MERKAFIDCNLYKCGVSQRIMEGTINYQHNNKGQLWYTGLRDKVNIIVPLCWQTLWTVTVPKTKEPDVSQLAVFIINDFDKSLCNKETYFLPASFVFNTVYLRIKESSSIYPEYSRAISSSEQIQLSKLDFRMVTVNDNNPKSLFGTKIFLLFDRKRRLFWHIACCIPFHYNN